MVDYNITNNHKEEDKYDVIVHARGQVLPVGVNSSINSYCLPNPVHLAHSAGVSH